MNPDLATCSNENCDTELRWEHNWQFFTFDSSTINALWADGKECMVIRGTLPHVEMVDASCTDGKPFVCVKYV